MKKALAFLMAAVMLMSMLTACGNKDNADNKDNNDVSTEETDKAAADKVAALIAAIYVQERTEETDAQCEAAKAAWDALTGEQILKAMSTKDDFKAELIAMAAKANEEHAHEDEEEEHEHHHHHDHDDDHDEHCCCGHHHHHDHDADEVFTSWGVETARKFSKADIEHALTELDTGNYGMILRSKGIVDGGADGWLEFDYVPGEWEVRARGADVGGKLVVIGSKLDEKAIAALFGC